MSRLAAAGAGLAHTVVCAPRQNWWVRLDGRALHVGVRAAAL